MKYAFDTFGWYIGEVDDSVKRSVDISPVNLSTDNTPGELRSNWNGNSWDIKSYTIQVIPAPKPKVPEAVTMRQARLALLYSGLYDTINTALTLIPDQTAKSAALIEWEYALFVNRNSALISGLQPMLGLTDDQLDALFITAGNIPD